MKIQPSKRITYKAKHKNYGSDNIFDSWMTLCECTKEIAIEKAIEALEDVIAREAECIEEEMIASVIEHINEP